MPTAKKESTEILSEESTQTAKPTIEMSDFMIPKIKTPDFSKINFRQFNWLTVFGILSYLQILALVPFFFGRKSPFVSFHARQGILLLFIWVLFLFSFFVPLLPWIFALYLVAAIVWGIVNVVMGRERELPLIGKLVK